MNVIFVVLTTVLICKFATCQHKMTCDSLIYCQGELLRTVQLSKVFKDCKTFVDMSMMYLPEVILKNFELMKSRTQGRPTKENITNFVNQNFQAAHGELENWAPPDFKTNPSFLNHIAPIKIKTFAKNLLYMWLNLGRKVKADVFKNSLKFSIIPVPNGFIIPGGRFREFYYWDSYWIVKGLLICEMIHTARGMLENFIHIVKTYGFIPNGGRIYYLDRSQPPILTIMVEEYMKVTNDMNWLQHNLKYLENELQFWLEKKTVEIFKDGEHHTLAHYRSYSDQPRPESYVEDVRTASYYSQVEEQRQCYRSIRSGAESGWDFSVRWIFDRTGGNRGNLSQIDASRVIPVDLNAILCKSFRVLYNFNAKFKHKDRAKYWLEKFNEWQRSINTILYNVNDGIWYDYDMKLSKPRKYFYPSNFAPLWTETYDTSQSKKFGRDAANYFNSQGIMDYQGGIPTSLTETGEQWDYPNAWAPLQSIVILGMEKTGDPEAREIAKEFARRWIHSTLKEYQDSKEMFEKYNAVFVGVFGTGGEYDVQTGFGWTNGVILELIDHFYVKNKILK